MQQQNGAYFSRSWKLLTRDRGWLKPVMMLSVAAFVPVAGLLGVHGYALEWARLTAWGVDAAPKQKDIRVGECIKSGWRGLCAGIGYSLVASFINNLLTRAFGGNFFVGMLTFLITMAGSLAYTLAALRATIYQSVRAGYQFDRLWEPVQRDPKGFAKVGLVTLACSLLVGVGVGLLCTAMLVPFGVRLMLQLEGSGLNMYYPEYLDEHTVRYLFFEFLDAFVAMAPWLAVLGFVVSCATTTVTLLTNTAVGLWLRQFDVPAWGASEDPLPVANGLPASGYYVAQDYGADQYYGAAQDYGAGQSFGAAYGQPEVSSASEPIDETQSTDSVEPTAAKIEPIDLDNM